MKHRACVNLKRLGNTDGKPIYSGNRQLLHFLRPFGIYAHPTIFEILYKGGSTLEPTLLYKQGGFIHKRFLSQEVDPQSEHKREFASNFLCTHAQDNGYLILRIHLISIGGDN